MNLVCPDCSSSIDLDDVNVSTDIALCRDCQKTYSFEKLQGRRHQNDKVDLTQLPKGCTFEEDFIGGWKIAFTLRSWALLFLVPFTCFWSGFSMYGIYIEPLMKGEFDLGQSLFGLPFLIGTIVLVTICSMMAFGKFIVVNERDRAYIAMGIGPLLWKKYFNSNEVTDVYEEVSHTNNGRNAYKVVIETNEKDISLPCSLKDKPRDFLISFLLEKFNI